MPIDGSQLTTHPTIIIIEMAVATACHHPLYSMEDKLLRRKTISGTAHELHCLLSRYPLPVLNWRIEISPSECLQLVTRHKREATQLLHSFINWLAAVLVLTIQDRRAAAHVQ